jgi:hypothetical protein
MLIEQLKLAAARKLALSVSSSDISKSKTRSLLGETLDLMSLEADGEDEDIAERLSGSAEQTRLLKRHMLAEAKTFRDLEQLIIVLDSLEIASVSVDSLRKYVAPFPRSLYTLLLTLQKVALMINLEKRVA